jgi:hypothetical protein
MTAASSDVLDDAGRRPIRVGISACLMGDEVRFDARPQTGRLLPNRDLCRHISQRDRRLKKDFRPTRFLSGSVKELNRILSMNR